MMPVSIMTEDADLAAPEHAVGVVGKEIALKHIDRGVDVKDLGGLLAAGEFAAVDLLDMVAHRLDHVEPRVAARLADAEHKVEVGGGSAFCQRRWRHRRPCAAGL